MNSTTPASIAEKLEQLNGTKTKCGAGHPFLKAFHLLPGPHSQVTTEIDGITCEGSYIRVVRDASGQVVNAVIAKQADSGVFEQLYVGGSIKLGHYVPALNKLVDGMPICVTVDTPSASQIAAATDTGAVAAMHAENLEAVVLAMRSAYPGSALTLAVDWKYDGGSQDPRTLRLVRELSHKLKVPYFTSGDEATFSELAGARGKAAILKRLETAEIPAAEDALSGVTTQKSPIPEAAIPATFPQNGEGLLRDIVTAVRRAVVTSEAAAISIALWIMFTHVYRSFSIAPLLVFSSPEKRCGKTNALTLLLRLVAAALPAGNLTEAVIYRSISMWSPTLLIDEADTFMVGQKGMAGIINSGYKAAIGHVLRTSKHGVESHNTFVPKAIALIGELSDTVMDRAIHVRLERKHRDEKVMSVPHRGPDGLTMLQARIIRWAEDHRGELASITVPRIEAINDRANDNAGPLLAIAAACSEAWLERAVIALKAMAGVKSDSLSVSTQLLADIRSIFEASQRDRLPTAELLQRLHALDESPWPSYSRGGPLTTRDMAEVLGRYGIKSHSMRQGEHVMRAYARHDFADAFKRYLN